MSTFALHLTTSVEVNNEELLTLIGLKIAPEDAGKFGRAGGNSDVYQSLFTKGLIDFDATSDPGIFLSDLGERFMEDSSELIAEAIRNKVRTWPADGPVFASEATDCAAESVQVEEAVECAPCECAPRGFEGPLMALDNLDPEFRDDIMSVIAKLGIDPGNITSIRVLQRAH